MSWIKTIPYENSSGYLRTLYDRVKGPDNNVDNIMMTHSLRPHTMDGHMVIYKNVLHHYSNSLPKWFLETIGVWVSLLNQCDYCVEHHFAGLKRLLNDDVRSNRLRLRLEAGDIESLDLTPREKLALTYARQLTLRPAEMTALLIEELRGSGFEDGEILEINQVAAYFNYANRTVLGLGASTDGDILGLSPGNSQNPDDWRHG